MANKDKQYLTTRLVDSLSKQAFSKASKQAMEDHGFIIVAKDGNIVKQFQDGKIEILEKIVQSEATLVLD